MKGCLTVLILISLNGFSQSLDKRSFKLTSLEGLPVEVIQELDYANNTATVALKPSESLCFGEFMDEAEDVKVLGNKFILFQYKMRGGSGIKLRRTILLCISKGHLYKAMDILSLNGYEFKETYNPEVDSLKLYDEHGFHEVNIIKLEKAGKGNYQLVATESKKVKSKVDPKKNQETLDTLMFHFDTSSKVFYTQKKSLNGNYIIQQSGKQRKIKAGQVPHISLKNDDYFFIDERWYYKVSKNSIDVLPACNK